MILKINQYKYRANIYYIFLYIKMAVII